MNDTIKPAIVFHLQEPIESITAMKKSDLNEKDLQFCCLVKSRLTTLELSEIYCVSQSAIFKRKQKIKELLGFRSDKRTLDAIFEGM